MSMNELNELLLYAKTHNMMNQDFPTVLQSYKNYLKDYYESLVADDEIERQAEENYYADAI